MPVLLDADELSLVDHTWGQAFDGIGVKVAWNGSFLPATRRGFRSPPENVLGDV